MVHDRFQLVHDDIGLISTFRSRAVALEEARAWLDRHPCVAGPVHVIDVMARPGSPREYQIDRTGKSSVTAVAGREGGHA